MSASVFVGRVSGLAVALGVGFALADGAGLASASPVEGEPSPTTQGPDAGASPRSEGTSVAQRSRQGRVADTHPAPETPGHVSSTVRPDPVLSDRVAGVELRAAATAGRWMLTTPPPAAVSATAVAGSRHVLSGGDLFLGGNYLELGISNVGSFGSRSARPTGFTGGTPPGSNPNSVGLAYDSDGFGSGTAPALDFYVPDTPEERWSVAFDDSRYAGFSALNSSGGNAANLTNTSLTDRSSGDTLSGKFTATVDGVLEVVQLHTFNVADTFFRTDVTLTNVSSTALANVEFMRSFDPDGTRSVGGSNTTTNSIGGQFAADEYSMVNASSLVNDAYNVLTGNLANIFLYARRDPKAVVYTGGFRNNNPYEFDSLSQSTGYTTTADDAIGIIFEAGDLAPGATVKFTYYTGVTVSADPLSVVKGVAASPTSTTGFSLAGLQSLFNDFLNPVDGVFRKILDQAIFALDVTGGPSPDSILGRIAGRILPVFSGVTSAIDLVEGPKEQFAGYPVSGTLKAASGVLGVSAFAGGVLAGAVGLATGVGVAAGVAAVATPLLLPLGVAAGVLAGTAWFFHDVVKI